MEEIGRRQGCETAALAVSLDREGALRLYEGRGYQKPSYAMRKALRWWCRCGLVRTLRLSEFLGMSAQPRLYTARLPM